MTERRTKRRYAHELYPDPDGFAEAGDVDKVVPHLYARALGLNVLGTGWGGPWDDPEVVARAQARTQALVDARLIAALVDAMAQSRSGQDAYSWAYSVAADESGECIWDRAIELGVDPYAIKPYPCGPEADYHYHYGEPDRWGTRIGISRPGRESECEACTEPVPTEEPTA